MTDTPTPETEEPTAEDALKRRLLNRIAIAAVMVVGLLGSLAMFDALNSPQRHPAQVASLPPKPEPAPVLEAPKEEPKPDQAAAPAGDTPAAADGAKPGEAAPASAEAKPETKAEAKPETPAVPERTASPGAPPLQPLPPEKPLTKPATTKPAAIRPSEPVPAAGSPAAKPDPAREIAQAPASSTPAAPRRAPASRPVSQAGERQFALQMGVFNNVANAEDLRAKLELHGIPSTIEARVHVGPFKTREEADAARAKLKELGMESGMLVTMKK